MSPKGRKIGFRFLKEKAMPITIDPKVEARLRERATAEGLTIEAYVERLVNAEPSAEEELEMLALEGLRPACVERSSLPGST
jgi:hypothetical protein